MTDQLQPLVAIWLPTQRWFGGKGRQATITVRELAELPGTTPVVTIWVADVQYADGSTETYQVPLVMHEQPAETLEHVLLGSLLDDGRAVLGLRRAARQGRHRGLARRHPRRAGRRAAALHPARRSRSRAGRGTEPGC